MAFGGKNTGYYPYQTQNETVFPYLVLYVNGQVYWERTISDLYYGMIKDAVVTERELRLLVIMILPIKDEMFLFMNIHLLGNCF